MKWISIAYFRMKNLHHISWSLSGSLKGVQPFDPNKWILAIIILFNETELILHFVQQCKQFILCEDWIRNESPEIQGVPTAESLEFTSFVNWFSWAATDIFTNEFRMFVKTVQVHLLTSERNIFFIILGNFSRSYCGQLHSFCRDKNTFTNYVKVLKSFIRLKNMNYYVF